MKSLLLASCLYLLMIPVASPLLAQTSATWQHLFEEPVAVRGYDKDLKLYFLQQGDELFAFDYAERKEVWRRSVGSDGLRLTTSSFPFWWVTGLRFSDGKRRGQRRLLLNGTTGEVVFDTDLIDLADPQDYYLLADANAIMIKGKENKERIYGTVDLATGQLLWKGPLPVQLKKITTRDVIKYGPYSHEEYLLFSYAGTLFCVDRDTGVVQWERPLPYPGRLALLFRPDTTHFTHFFIIDSQEEGYRLQAINWRDGSPAWPQPFNLGGWYGVDLKADHLLVRTAHRVNYLNYDTGEPRWSTPPTFDQYVDQAYARDSTLLVQLVRYQDREVDGKTVRDTSYSFNWVNERSEVRWSQPAEILGQQIKRVWREDDRLIYLTDRAVGAVNYATGEKLYADLPLPGTMSVVDTTHGHLLVVDDEKFYRLHYRTGQSELLLDEIKLRGEDTGIDEIRYFANHYALLSPRNLLLISAEGELLRQQYFRKPGVSQKLKRTLVAVGGLVAGAVFREEMMEINRALYEEEEISQKEYVNARYANALYGRAGSGLVGGTYAQRLLPVSPERRLAVTQAFNRLWLVPDKLDQNLYGLRVIDVVSGEETHTVPLGNKLDFTFQTDLMEGGLLQVDEKSGQLRFFDLVNN